MDTLQIQRPTMLAVGASLLGLATIGALVWMSSRNEQVSPPLLATTIPFLIGLGGAYLRTPQARTLTWWLAASICVFPAALTIFSGLAVLFVICLMFYLVAAWMENEASGNAL